MVTDDLPGTKFVTIGGAIANDIHGKAHHIDGSFVNCVVSFTILLADGTTVEASRTGNSDLFWANFGGLGLLGVILKVRLRLRKIETTYFKQKSMVIKNLDHMLEALDKYDRDYNYSVAWIDALAKGGKLGSGVLTLGNAARREELPEKLKANPLKLHSKGKLGVPFFFPSFTLNGFTVRILNRVIALCPGFTKGVCPLRKVLFPARCDQQLEPGLWQAGFYPIPVRDPGGER